MLLKRFVLTISLSPEDPSQLSLLEEYSHDGKTVCLEDFERFLREQQYETPQNASQIICDFIQDPQRNIQKPYFFVEEVSISLFIFLRV